MTSPRQRKKRLRAFLSKQKQNAVLTDTKQATKQPAEPVALVAPSVVESEPVSKAKKSKNALVETKSQDQVVEQLKAEVKTEAIVEQKVENKTETKG